MTYRDLQGLVADMLQTENLKRRIPDFIRFAQLSLERKLFVSGMESYPVNASLTIGTNSIAIPSDYRKLIEISLVDGKTRYPLSERLKGITYTSSFSQEVGDTTNTGRPVAFRRAGSVFQFNCYADKTYEVEYAYFVKASTLTNEGDTNWWTLNADDLLLYATLVEIAPLLPKISTSKGFVDDTRVTLWASLYNMKFADVQGADNIERMSGTRHRTRYSD